MIDLTVVSGPLGAGKTTWLLQQADLLNCDLLVTNDVADVSIDDSILAPDSAGAGRRTVCIAGGCVCCTAWPDLRNALLQCVNEAHIGTGRHDRQVLLEVSGAAEPDQLLRRLTDDPVLGANVRVARLTVVLDGSDAVRGLRHEAAVRTQVSVADEVVLTRADVVGPTDLRHAAGVVRGLRPDLRLTATARGADHPLGPVVPEELLVGDDVDGAVGGLSTLAVRLSARTRWAEYALWLHAMTRRHPAGLVRSKGYVTTPAGRALVQSVGAAITVELVPTAAVAPDSRAGSTDMTYVLRGLDRDQVRASLSRWVPSAGAADD